MATQPSVQAREVLLQRCTFMRTMTDQVLVELGEYFESVRDEAQGLLLCLSQRFFPAEISFTQDELDLAHMMRANITHGWALSKGTELKEAAAEESKMLSYLFSDASVFVSKLLTIYMDETYGRDNYLSFFKLLNTVCPFLILNDYRVSEATKSLRRAELIKKLLTDI